MANDDMPDRPAHSPMEKGGSLPLKILKFTLLFLFLLLQVYLFFFKPLEVQDYFPYTNEAPLPLFGDNQTLCQEFRSPGPLSRIDIMLANYKVKPKGGSLRFTIYKENRLLFFKNFPANSIEDNRFFSCKIPPNKVPAGFYRFQLSFFPLDRSDRLAAWSSPGNLYPHGSLSVDGKPVPGDLTFRVYYLSTLWIEKDRWLSQAPPSRFRSIALAFGSVVFLLVINGLFYFFCLRRPGGLFSRKPSPWTPCKSFCLFSFLSGRGHQPHEKLL